MPKFPGRPRTACPPRLSAGTRDSEFVKFIKANATLIALVVLVAVLSVADDTFLTPRNLSNLARQVTIIGIVGVGMTMVILIGGIDLSVGSVVGLAAIVDTLLMQLGAERLAVDPGHPGRGRRRGRRLERVLDHLLQDPAVHHHAGHADHRPRLGAGPVGRHLGAGHRPDFPGPRRRLHSPDGYGHHPGAGRWPSSSTASSPPSSKARSSAARSIGARSLSSSIVTLVGLALAFYVFVLYRGLPVPVAIFG